MLHLIRLEMKKIKLSRMLITVIIINSAILCFLMLINLDSKDKFNNFAEMLTIIELLVGATFVIYSSVLLARFIINEFRQKTITILFMYPIDRKKLLFSKLIIVYALTFCFVAISVILLSIGFCLVNDKLQFVPNLLDALTMNFVVNQTFHLIIYAASCAGMALIPLFFGMMKKSVSTTIVSSILIVFLLMSGGNPVLGSEIVVLGSLGIAGLLIAYLTIRKVINADL